MICFPHAKINLGLHVLNRRPDGFHNIATLFYPIPFHDMLEIVPAASTALHVSGLSVESALEDNLCMKAYRLLERDYPLPPVAIYLHKVIPMGAGLGGGSSNAAHTLLMLNNLFRLNIPEQQLFDYAATLGSDCPFFIQSQPALACGRGEVLQYSGLRLNGYYLLLALPDVHVSTAEAYAGVSPKAAAVPLEEIIKLPVAQWKNSLANDFETKVFTRYPQLAGIKAQLYEQGAVYAAMSGSGSTLFGLLDAPPHNMPQHQKGNVIYKCIKL